ncbi:unnamed protein product [marine sediment metagenome]|uniref:Uncharacterized protein n=1 Tax=marine sediment metagenome TaxID=412755 RepID=X1EDL1_9ZZZZ
MTQQLLQPEIWIERVSVRRDYDGIPSSLGTCLPQLYDAHIGHYDDAICIFLGYFYGFIGATIIHDYDFIGRYRLSSYGFEVGLYELFLVKSWNNNRGLQTFQ